MLIKLAWRNLWRNKRRSILIQLSIIIGVIAIITLDSFSNGMLYQMLFNQISTKITHIQIHKKGFNDNKLIQSLIPDYKNVEKILQANPDVKFYSKRVVAFGLTSSASNSTGVYINGIIPNDEANVSTIKSSIIRGKYLSGALNEIITSEKLAQKLDITIGDKIVIMSNTLKGNIGSELFRITGLFSTFSSEFDKTNIYITLKSSQKLLEVGDNIYEFALITNDINKAPKIAAALSQKLSTNYEIMSYEDILPLIIIQLDMYKQLSFFITLIISLAMIFGIINTMLMAVFERIREFGVLMSIGMKNSKLFFMIIMESFILGVIGTIIGTVVGLAVQMPLMHFGLNLSVFTKSLDSFGLGAIIYPTISIENTFITFLTIPIISIIGALYPAFKAIRLQPINALHYV
ncbi:MAG: FtsX-like permease family protein [bacterium]